MASGQVHVVFGAGQIGTPLAKRLRGLGHEVRLARRSSAPAPEGVTPLVGDAGDPSFVADAARGARALYHCMNPAYDRRVWARELPRLMSSLIAAAGRAGARLVVLDNLYMLGDGGGRPLNEDTPVAPRSRKGEIRAQVAAMLFEAHRRGEVRAVSGRASDFFGPGGTQTYFGDAFWPRVIAGKSAQVLSNPDIQHTYHYTLDVAAGLAALGTAEDDVTGRWWMLPAVPAETTRALIARFATALGHEIRVERIPAWMLDLMALFVPLLREVSEMRYQWEQPLVVDDRRFRERFGQTPTSLDDGARATVAWAREHYKRRGS